MGFFVIAVLVLFGITPKSYALYDPLSRDNNFHGIHILFPYELGQAKELVNSNGGDWGYVTIPIQIGDRDLVKWQLFMDEARKNHLIPILRLATEPYYANTSVWRRPSDYDIVDLANFLNSLNWPTENRYIIVFNEMNRFDEWQGNPPSPDEYAEVLAYTYEAFKKRNGNFYIIMGGLDNAAPSDGKHMNVFEYLKDMHAADAEIFNKMDGFSSHSYPNPAFAQPPGTGRMSVATYRYEYDYINQFTNSKKPAFITETGWDNQAVSSDRVAQYFTETYSTIWNEDRDKIVAITPFLLNSVGGPFDKFSFVKDGKPAPYFSSVQALKKVTGKPVITSPQGPLFAAQSFGPATQKSFEEMEDNTLDANLATKALRIYAKAFLGLN